MQKKMTRNPYIKYARIYPAIVAMIIPCLASTYYVYKLGILNEYFTQFSSCVKMLALFVPSALLYSAIGYLGVEVFRSISKILFQYGLFGEDETNMPTTDLLIFSHSTFSETYINRIINKIEKDFHISIKSKEEQRRNETEARKEIVNAVQCIREKTRDNEILLQYNIQFGFCRNLMGGLVVASMISVALIIACLTQGMSCRIQVAFLGIELIAFLLSFWFLKYRGKAYAKQLYAAYLTKK